MALADYYLCDVCRGKAFYDANGSQSYFDACEQDRIKGLCDKCVKCHEIVIKARLKPCNTNEVDLDVLKDAIKARSKLLAPCMDKGYEHIIFEAARAYLSQRTDHTALLREAIMALEYYKSEGRGNCVYNDLGMGKVADEAIAKINSVIGDK